MEFFYDNEGNLMGGFIRRVRRFFCPFITCFIHGFTDKIDAFSSRIGDMFFIRSCVTFFNFNYQEKVTKNDMCFTTNHRSQFILV
jgi:hypothetical protein